MHAGELCLPPLSLSMLHAQLLRTLRLAEGGGGTGGCAEDAAPLSPRLGWGGGRRASRTQACCLLCALDPGVGGRGQAHHAAALRAGKHKAPALVLGILRLLLPIWLVAAQRGKEANGPKSRRVLEMHRDQVLKACKCLRRAKMGEALRGGAGPYLSRHQKSAASLPSKLRSEPRLTCEPGSERRRGKGISE